MIDARVDTGLAGDNAMAHAEGEAVTPHVEEQFPRVAELVDHDEAFITWGRRGRAEPGRNGNIVADIKVILGGGTDVHLQVAALRARKVERAAVHAGVDPRNAAEDDAVVVVVAGGIAGTAAVPRVRAILDAAQKRLLRRFLER